MDYNILENQKLINEHTSEAERFNILGQLESLQRIKKSGELESSYKKEQITKDGKTKRKLFLVALPRSGNIFICKYNESKP